MIPKELAKKIRTIQIHTKKAVNDILAGEYESAFKGRGMEFDEVREYQPGDEIRTIDWNVTARTGRPHVKRYVEERELTVFFLVDLSASGLFGSGGKMKSEVAAELCALLAFSAIKNNDKAGLLVFTDQVEMFIPPKKGTSHVLRLIRELLCFVPNRPKTDINIGLDYFARVIRKRCVAFLISDFIAPDFSVPLRMMAKKHDMITVSITDPFELKMPNVGLIELEDAESGELVLLDTGSKKIRHNYEKLAQKRQLDLAALFGKLGVGHIPLITEDDYVKDLVRFFKSRGRSR